LFSLERVEKAFASCFDEPPDRTIERIAEAVERHRGDAPQRDDVTMVLAEFVPEAASRGGDHAAAAP